MKIKFFILFIFLFLSIFSSSVFAQDSNVLIVEITDTIDRATVSILEESMLRADVESSEAIILLINTPGGGLQETFDIADLIQFSEIPIVGFVYPSGSYAWSAGTFILMSTHIAAMSDHTVIGSCQPVEVGLEGTRLINDSKRINALVEWIKERANMYDRNVTLAEEFITINRNVNQTDAFEFGVIEFGSSSIDDLLNDIDGIVVNIYSENITLNTENAEKIFFTPSLKTQFLKIISNPMLTSLLLMLGIFALIFGISSPGVGAEVFGVIAIMLSLFGSGFAISTLSIIFIIIGCLLLIIEIFATPGFGVIGIGGITCLVIGSIFLIPSYSSMREWVISMDWINDLIIILVVTVVLIAIFFVFLLYKIIQIRNKKAAVGTFKGEKAKVIERITPDKPGFVLFKGEYWQATSNTTIEPKTRVIIVDKDESTLVVKPKL